MPMGPPSQVPEPKSACTCADRPMAATYVAEAASTGRWSTGVRQMLPGGATSHPPRSGAPAGGAVRAARPAAHARAVGFVEDAAGPAADGEAAAAVAAGPVGSCGAAALWRGPVIEKQAATARAATPAAAAPIGTGRARRRRR